MINKNTITSIDNDEVREMITRYADLKSQENSISGEIKAISELFKETTDNIIMRNQPYLINHNGRSFCFKIEKKNRTTTDQKAIADEFSRIGLDMAAFQKTQEVQSFSVTEQKLFD